MISGHGDFGGVVQGVIIVNFCNAMLHAIGQRFDKQLQRRLSPRKTIRIHVIASLLTHYQLTIPIQPPLFHLNAVARHPNHTLNIIGLAVMTDDQGGETAGGGEGLEGEA